MQQRKAAAAAGNCFYSHFRVKVNKNVKFIAACCRLLQTASSLSKLFFPFTHVHILQCLTFLRRRLVALSLRHCCSCVCLTKCICSNAFASAALKSFIFYFCEFFISLLLWLLKFIPPANVDLRNKVAVQHQNFSPLLVVVLHAVWQFKSNYHNRKNMQLV